MSLKQRLMDDLKAALKGGERQRVDCVRMLRAKILEREVALRPEKGAHYELDDDETRRVLAAYAKQRREAIEEFAAAGRHDLAAREQAELAIVQNYLPQPLGEAELVPMVRQAIAELGASTARDLGAVVKLVLSRAQGAADGKLVQRLVREALGVGG